MAFTFEASAGEYSSRAVLERVLVQTDGETGWADTAVEPDMDFRGELLWDSWGAYLWGYVCLDGTALSCRDFQAELLHRFVRVGEDGVAQYIRSLDVRTLEDRHYHVLAWEPALTAVTTTEVNGERFILLFQDQ
jgi:hypothetical protein